ncbi:MAG: FecR domain-containing protein [Kofleriaceae bacterium]|nr:FecR domain-containing protein [Kofleriaceae bacterium]MBP6839838.1 FecR domain-containing protein [Kofleriaceae bacterium]MBP9207375.1 FecR domain-containing protein [Kofleriaceae bacterium]
MSRDPLVPRELGAVLDPVVDEARLSAGWRRLAEARAQRPLTRARAPRWPWLAGLTLAGATAAVVLIAMRDHAPATAPTIAVAPLSAREPGVALDAGSEVRSAEVARPVALDDGSLVTLAPHSQWTVLSNEADRFVTVLADGRAHFAVQPGGPRRWEIETPLATVEVVGTAFEVAHDAHHLLVTVERGVVMVRGERVPGRVARLTAGERLEVLAPGSTTAAAPAGPVAPATASAAPALAASASRPEVTPTAPRRASVATVAPSAQTSTTPPAGLAATARPPESTARRLIAEADQLRRDGRARDAAAVLTRLLAEHPRDPAAGLAAFTLGRIALDQLAEPRRAAEAFATVITLGSPHALLEDAYARRAEALLAAGDRAGARAAVDAYVRAYPDRPRGAALRARVDRTAPPPGP